MGKPYLSKVQSKTKSINTNNIKSSPALKDSQWGHGLDSVVASTRAPLTALSQSEPSESWH